jgi:GNAT superfamily N-acetyltransferase
MNIEFKIADRNWKKNMWNNRFRRDYSGKLRFNSEKLKRNMVDSSSLYVEMAVDGEHCGFSRLINNLNDMYKDDGIFIRIIQEIYVDQAYRNKGLAGELIRHLRDHYSARSIFMEKDRAEKLKFFHMSMGFDRMLDHPLYSDMVYVTYNPSINVGNFNVAPANDNQDSNYILQAA